MKLVNIVPGSAEWISSRSASKAPAMMGASKYQSRNELIRLMATGIAEEFSEEQERLFKLGHTTEDAAREILQEMYQEELYPASGMSDDGYLTANFDGLSMDWSVGVEHKTWNEELAAMVRAGDLSPQYYWQLEQQCLVSGLESILFVCSDGTREKWVDTEYFPVPGRAEQLIAGWKQLDADLANYQPVEVIPAAVAAPVMALPAVSIKVDGAVALITNLDVFGAGLQAFIERIPKRPSTDQEFADCKAACKTLQEAQDALDAAEAHAMGQVASFDEMRRAKAMLFELARATRLAVEKLVAAREQTIKVEIVQKGKDAYEKHVESLKAETGGPWIVLASPDFAGAIKGKRTIASIQNAVDTTLANGKIAADASAKRIREALACLKADGQGYEFLFSDRLALIGKPIDDLKLLIKSRIDGHKAAEEKKEAETRERARIEAEARLRADAEAKARIEAEAKAKVEREEGIKAEAEERNRREIEEATRKANEQRAIDLAAKEAATRTKPEELNKAATVGGSQPVDASKEPVAAVPGQEVKTGQIPAARSAALSVVRPKAIPRPSDGELINVIAEHYRVDQATAADWLCSIGVAA